MDDDDEGADTGPGLEREGDGMAFDARAEIGYLKAAVVRLEMALANLQNEIDAHITEK